jgi:CopG family nickel-responsive transcriptional regulator
MVERIGITVDGGLLERFDKLIRANGITNRSEAIRDLIQARLVREASKRVGPDAVAAVVLAVDPQVYRSAHLDSDAAMNGPETPLSTLQVQLDEHLRLEVVTLRGSQQEIEAAGRSLLASSGVRYGRLFDSRKATGLRATAGNWMKKTAGAVLDTASFLRGSISPPRLLTHLLLPAASFRIPSFGSWLSAMRSPFGAKVPTRCDSH